MERKILKRKLSPPVFYYVGIISHKPSFVEEAARIFDFAGVLSLHTHVNNKHADYLALSSDWHAVGHDIRTAMQTFDPSHG